MSTTKRTPEPPPTPHPTPIVPAGPSHGGACRYPFELGFLQEMIHQKWDKTWSAVEWVIRTQKLIYTVLAIILGALVTIGLSLGASCRAAGAQEERLNTVRSTVQENKVVTDQTLRDVQDEQRRQYDKMFTLMSGIDSQVKSLNVKLQTEDDMEARQRGRNLQ